MCVRANVHCVYVCVQCFCVRVCMSWDVSIDKVGGVSKYTHTRTHKHAHTHTHTGPPIKVPMRTSDKGHHFKRSHFGHGHFDHDALVVQIHHNRITNNVRALCGTATAEARGQDLKCPTNALCIPVSVCVCVCVFVCVCVYV